MTEAYEIAQTFHHFLQSTFINVSLLTGIAPYLLNPEQANQSTFHPPARFKVNLIYVIQALGSTYYLYLVHIFTPMGYNNCTTCIKNISAFSGSFCFHFLHKPPIIAPLMMSLNILPNLSNQILHIPNNMGIHIMT